MKAMSTVVGCDMAGYGKPSCSYIIVLSIVAYSRLHDALQKAGMSALFRECSFSLSYVGLKVDNIYDRVSNASRNLF